MNVLEFELKFVIQKFTEMKTGKKLCYLLTENFLVNIFSKRIGLLQNYSLYNNVVHTF